MVKISSSSSHVGEEYCGCFVNAVFVLERLGPCALTLSTGRNEMTLMVAEESSGTSQLHTSKPSIWAEYWGASCSLGMDGWETILNSSV